MSRQPSIRRPPQSLPPVFLFTFGGVGALLLVIAAVLYFFDQQHVNQSMRVEGEVVRNQYKGSMCRPVVRYTWMGEEKLYFSNTYSNPPAFEKGERVELLVNPAEPDHVMVNSFSERFLAIIILAGIGGFFLGFIILFNYLWNKS